MCLTEYQHLHLTPKGTTKTRLLYVLTLDAVRAVTLRLNTHTCMRARM